MLFMLSKSMDLETECRQKQTTENKTETVDTASDRESSIESFYTNKSELSITTETELIDVDDIELSDEESWLYKSPKKQLSEEKASGTKLLEKDIDDMDDAELKATRTALLSKLNQLKLLNSSIEEKGTKTGVQAFHTSNCVEKGSVRNAEANDCIGANKTYTVSSPQNKESCAKVESWKTSEIFDVEDVQKIARLQEESLKQSTYKFLSHAGKRSMSGRNLSPASPAQIVTLNKPASIEALNTCSEKANHSSAYSMVPLHNMKKQNIFSSASALNCSQEFHRSSLPNINKGYYSLKSKKPKRPSEPKISCPLPIHPSHSKVSLNGVITQTSNSRAKSATAYDHRESRTLPSSYRVHSRSNSSHRSGNMLSPSPRRESMPFLGTDSTESHQRDNTRKYSSPLTSMTVYPRYTSSATVSPTKPYSSQFQNPRSPPGLESHRAASHSPSRRLPLSTVQHQSPKKGNSLTFPRNGEIRAVKVSSKIPSPALRSGIPVPSSASKASDDTWSQDCF